MIQRVQTIYFSIIKIFALLFLFLPIGQIKTETKLYFSLANVEVYKIMEGSLGINWLRYIVIASAILVMILTLVITFSYKNRQKQIKLNQFNMLLHILMLVLAFFFIDSIKEPFNYSIAILFPLLSLILIILANKAVKKDDELVRSADRLR